MSIPTKDDIKNLNWAYIGRPFVETARVDTIDLTTMNWAYIGRPFVANPAGLLAPPPPPPPPPPVEVRRRAILTTNKGYW